MIMTLESRRGPANTYAHLKVGRIGLELRRMLVHKVVIGLEGKHDLTHMYG